MKDGGYGYHAKMFPNITETLNSLDVQAVKAELGLLYNHEGNN
jgi:hypothetical protein